MNLCGGDSPPEWIPTIAVNCDWQGGQEHRASERASREQRLDRRDAEERCRYARVADEGLMRGGEMESEERGPRTRGERAEPTAEQESERKRWGQARERKALRTQGRSVSTDTRRRERAPVPRESDGAWKNGRGAERSSPREATELERGKEHANAEGGREEEQSVDTEGARTRARRGASSGARRTGVIEGKGRDVRVERPGSKGRSNVRLRGGGDERGEEAVGERVAASVAAWALEELGEGRQTHVRARDGEATLASSTKEARDRRGMEWKSVQCVRRETIWGEEKHAGWAERKVECECCYDQSRQVIKPPIIRLAVEKQSAKTSLWEAAREENSECERKGETAQISAIQGERDDKSGAPTGAGGAVRKTKTAKNAKEPYAKRRASTKQLLCLIGCPANHDTKAIQPRGATSKTRRRYICGHRSCRREFVQMHPAKMAEDGIPYEKREARWTKKRLPEMEVEQTKAQKPKRTAMCVGDTRIAYNNSGGLGDAGKHLRWARKMMDIADIVIGAESNLGEAGREDFSRAARADPFVRARVEHAGYHRKGTGLLVMVSDRVNAGDMSLREVMDTKLQLVVVDVTINNIPHRIIGGHAPSTSDLRVKKEYYEKVARALQHIHTQDQRNPFAPSGEQRVVIWGQDRNMTRWEEDEEGIQKKGGERRRELEQAVEIAEHEAGGEAGMIDTFRLLRGKERNFTHGKRRIDTVSVAENVVNAQGTPRVIKCEHRTRTELEIQIPGAGRKWVPWQPEHKAVVITMRYRDEEKGRATWKCTGKTYPKETKEAARREIEQALNKRVAATCIAAGGRVVLQLRTRTEEEKMQDWQEKTREILQAHEKKERVRRGKTASRLETERRNWAKEAAAPILYKEDYGRRAEAKRRLEKTVKKIRALAAAREEEREQDIRQRTWHSGADGHKSLFDIVRGRGGGGDLMKLRDKEGNEVNSTEGIRDIVDGHFDATFNLHEKEREMGKGEEGRKEVVASILQEVRDHVSRRGRGVFEDLSIDSILGEENLKRAIREVKKGTVPAKDGFDTSWYAQGNINGMMIGHLQALFRECIRNGELTEAMKTAIITVLHKGKGKDPELMKSYRPVSITPSEYRILTRAIQQKLQGACAGLIGRGQVGYLGKDRQTRDNTLLFTTMLHTLEKERAGGVIVQLDNAAAFDRVRWDFMGELMEAFGFPQDIRELIKGMYTGIGFRTKVNGKVGERHAASNGVRQGCGASPLLYILVQEALLISLRKGNRLKGLSVGVGRRTVHTHTFQEMFKAQGVRRVLDRCFADDTMIYLRSAQELPELFRLLRRYEIASGQALNASKSVAILAGEAKDQCLPCDTEIKYARYGEDDIEESLGITVECGEALEKQWEERHGRVRKEAEKMQYVRKEMGVSARVIAAKTMVASKLPYRDAVQVPERVQQHLQDTQRALDAVVFGEKGKAWHFIARDAAKQPVTDGGIGHTCVKARAEAEWGNHVTAMLQGEDSWKTMWWEELRKTYGRLTGPELLKGTCAFHLMQENESATELQRQSFRVWGQLKSPKVEHEREEGSRRGSKSGGEQEQEGQVTAAYVKRQRIFFNPHYEMGTVLTGRSKGWLEREAVKWAGVGLVCVGDLLREDDRDLIAKARFERRYPDLSSEVYAALEREISAVWREAMREDKQGPEVVDVVHVGTHETLQKESKCTHEKLSVREIYNRVLAKEWKWPKAFQESGEARAIWSTKRQGEAEDVMRRDAGRIYSGMRHKAVPAWMADRVYKAATGTEFVGEKFLGAGVKCPRCGQVEGKGHASRECEEVKKVWRLVLRAWHEKTGERLREDDAWVTAWGARWSEWKDEKEQEEHRPTEEVWRVLHAATVVAVGEERQRRKPRGATQIIHRVRELVSEIARMRERRGRPEDFHKKWVRTGMAKVGRGGAVVTLWDGHRRVRPGGQTGAVPDTMPLHERAVEEIYTDGSGGSEGLGAGYGWVRVEKREKEVASGKGEVCVSSTSREFIGADKHTNNTGELSAIYWGIKAAERDGIQEVVIRYDSKYAAGMARGIWKPKSNKELVQRVRQAVQGTSITLWWKHVKGHSGDKWNDRADELADEGVKMRAEEGRLGKGKGVGGGKTGGERERGARGGVRHTVEAEYEEERSVSIRITEVDRILRARTRHGTLNTHAHRKNSIRGEEIRERGRRCMQEIARGGGEQGRVQEAERRVEKAVRELLNPTTRRAEERERRRVKCTAVHYLPIDEKALEEVVEQKGAEGVAQKREGQQKGGLTVEEAVERLTGSAERGLDGEVMVGRDGRPMLRIEYRMCEKGRDLFEAGHVTGAREYAIGVDPFKWRKQVRHMIMRGHAVEYDDSAAFVRIRMKLVEAGREICEKFIDNRECVMGGYGERLFAEESGATRRDRMKGIVSGYDMGSGLDAWAKVHGNPHKRTLKGMRVTLCSGECKHRKGAKAGGGEFDLEEYRKAQLAGTESMAKEMPRMLEMLRELAGEAEKRQPGKVERTLKSFRLQEGEAVARQAKVRWCGAHGLQVYQLQHDGIAVERKGDVVQAARDMSVVASAACALRVVVVGEAIT